MKKIGKIWGRLFGVILVMVTMFTLSACGGSEISSTPKTFVNVDFEGYQFIMGEQVWHAGADTYYTISSLSLTYKFNPETKSWGLDTSMTLPVDFDPRYIWTDGENTYYSYCYSESSASYTHKQLNDKGVWEDKTWYNLTKFSGDNVWSDGTNVYYSCEYNPTVRQSQQYVLDKTTSMWKPMNWGNLTDFDGKYVWTDGNNVYYRDAFVLDKQTQTWQAKVWDEETWGDLKPNAIDWSRIWSDGKNTYYSFGNRSNQYIFAERE